MTHTIIIAEAGVNHNGSLATAIEMVHAASAAGVDYVKFQTFKAEKLVSAGAAKAQYQQENCPGMGDTQLQMLRSLQLSSADFALLQEECGRCGVGFLSSPFDLDSIELLASLGMDYWKVPSGEITNLPYLEKIGAQRSKVILSTGLSTLDEVAEAVEVLERSGTPCSNIILLQCNTQYPTPMRDVNLRAMNSLATLGCGAVGYSDHTPGVEVPIAAVALGAKVIEKHFTLDKSMPGPDHKASLDPQELTLMVQSVRNVEMALGSEHKCVSASEQPNIAVARKSIVAACPIRKGDTFTNENITAKRPGTGVSPMRWHEIIGRKATQDYLPDEQIAAPEV